MIIRSTHFKTSPQPAGRYAYPLW